jgi:hypothetical protein
MMTMHLPFGDSTRQIAYSLSERRTARTGLALRRAIAALPQQQLLGDRPSKGPKGR